MKLILALSLSVFALAAADKPPVLSQKYLDKVTAHWQHKLKLDDWIIRTSAVSLESLDPGSWGMSQTNPLTRTVSLSVLRPEDYARAAVGFHEPLKTPKQIRDDITDTIVHELVHVRLFDLVNSSSSTLDQTAEMTVNRWTAILLGK